MCFLTILEIEIEFPDPGTLSLTVSKMAGFTSKGSARKSPNSRRDPEQRGRTDADIAEERAGRGRVGRNGAEERGNGGSHGSSEARTVLRDSEPWKSSAWHYSMMVGDPKNVYWNPID